MRQLRNYDGRDKMRKPANDMMNDAMSKYGNLDEDGLIRKLNESVEESKRNGTFDPGAVLQFASQISPMLDERQREKLANLLRVMGCE